MDLDQFDGFTRQLHDPSSARRSLLRALGSMILGGALSGVVARLGLTEDAAAKPKRHQSRRKHRDQEHRPAGGLQTEGKRKKKRKRKKQCSELTAPLCQPCQEPRCNTATGTWSCQNTCRAGFTCCNGLCEPNCENGCTMNSSNACVCETPGSGQVYCAAEHLCAANPCKSGQEYDATTCTCRDKSPDKCGPGWEWCNGACRDATYGPWTTCGNTCCRSDEECCNGHCVLKQFGPFTPCGDTCCPDKTSECCNGQCLPMDLGPWGSCGEVCYRTDYEKCCSPTMPCQKEAVCCPNRCCPNGYTCCGDSCCR
jgi:hypothetical protein